MLETGKINKSLKRINKPKRSSLLKRIFSAGSFKPLKSRTASDGSITSSNTSRIDGSDRNLTDNVAIDPPNTPVSSTGSVASTLLRGLKRKSSQEKGGGLSITPPSSGRWINVGGGTSSSFSMMNPEEYAAAQLNLQQVAEDRQREGNTEQAIESWVEALELAEIQQDTLAIKTQILCMLVILHLQVANKQNQEEIILEEEFQLPTEAVAVSESNTTTTNNNNNNNNNNSENLDQRRQLMARRRSKLIKPGLGERVHHQAAKRYLDRIKPYAVKPNWLGQPTNELKEFLCQHEAWELAIMVSDQMIMLHKGKEEPDYKQHKQLASMHYQVACQKLDAQKQKDALQHLQATVSCMQKVPADIRDTRLYLQVLDLLATEYESQQEYESALETYKEEIIHTPTCNLPRLHCQVAQVYIEMGQLNRALENIDLAKQIGNTYTSSSQGGIRCQVLRTKGDIYLRLGRVDESLECYQQALDETDGTPAEKAKLLYNLGRLCIKLNRIRSAITYFTRELEITKQELGQNHFSVSRVLHQLAKLYDTGLGEHKLALMKYNKALNVELAVLHDCHRQVTQCLHCNHETHRMCTRHAIFHRTVSTQIRETKKCLGRIHYKLGDFERAMKISFMDKEATAQRRREKSLNYTHP